MHIFSSSCTYCIIFTLDFQCIYMKFYLSLPGLFYLARHTSTGHSIKLNTHGKDATFVSSTPLPTSTLCYVTGIFHVTSTCGDRGRMPSLPPNSLCTTYPGFLLLLKSRPFSFRSPHVRRCTLLAPNEPWSAHHCFGIVQVFWSPTLSNILTMTVRVVCNHMLLRTDIQPSSA